MQIKDRAALERVIARAATTKGLPMITLEQFREIHLRVAKIVAAERIERSEKLLRLQVDLGNTQRQIIAGIGARYQPDQLIGRAIIIVANLEPRAIMGFESQGMLLAANSAEGPVLLAPDQETPAGSPIQ